MRRSFIARAIALCAASSFILSLPSPARAGYASSVVASGLNNPRGLAFGPDGGLYIAEAGFLGSGGPQVVVRGVAQRYGTNGSITRTLGGVQTRIVTGLPSLSATTTGETGGPQDIAFASDGTGYVVVGLGADPAVRSGALGSGAGAANLGRILTFTTPAPGSFADVAAYEGANNPAGGAIDSNPYHIAIGPNGVLVTDAGANTLLNAATDGTVSLVATFPGRNIGGGFPSDSVSTGVTVGPDGAFYVGELTGFPFTPGAAQVYRVVPGEDPTVFRSGFTNITDIAFGDDGSLYVLQLDADGLLGPAVGGSLIRVATDGTRQTLFSTGLVTPTGLAIGDDGAFYVANYSAATGRGEVLRIAAIPEPATWAMMIAGFALVGGRMRGSRSVMVASPA